MRVIANQAPTGGAIPVSRVKIPEPKPFCGARDAKALENYIFDLKQYFRATNTVIEEAKVTLAMMHLSKDAKLCSSPGRNRNSRPSSPKAVGGDKRSGVINQDSDDKSNQAEGEVGQIDGGEKTRIGAIKYMSSLQKKSGERHIPTKRGLLYVDTWINQKQTKSTMVDSGTTHNFITEAEARRLNPKPEYP
ncbi:senescence-specific cysteine protease sag39 [Cucumis melo var. makuwa]|uniref:Senescence-specific cysteine protease sag39 n=1 Tax=Cucumis melo var. makuwa TaxID=1194695 RepID=A0A5A7VM21_CUCMM|nr:senescence-specific cysteine protease sag39 [Cucumis melo var. makuwa]TYK27841.1 senescence-specific cysteine protease sag39 [Cucumis melo var. makuwa]